MSYNDQEELFNNSSISRFNIYYLEEIIELVFHLQDSFSNPFFLCYINSQNLIELFNLFDKHNSSHELDYLNGINKIDFDLFYDEFENEIKISYNLIDSFLKKLKCNADYKLWSFFCFKYTDINCLH